MEGKADLLLEMIHPLVKDLTEVLKKHAEKASKLGENEKISYLQATKELTDILIDAYRKDVLQETSQHIDISSFMSLINIYLNIGFRKIDEDEKVI